MDAKCLGIIKFCRTRITLLDADGAAVTGENASYVSDQSVSLAINADIEAATRRTVRNGCDCVVATDPGRAILLGYNLELVSGTWEPAMQHLMLGSDALYDEVLGTQIIGLNHTGGDILGCGEDEREVAFEAWAQAYNGAGPDGDLPWKHYVWPRTKWSRSPETLGVEFTNPGLAGVVLANEGWGSGPYDDVPNDGTTPAVIDFFAEWFTATEPPAASCALQTVS
jgi:hypothetical protein